MELTKEEKAWIRLNPDHPYIVSKLGIRDRGKSGANEATPYYTEGWGLHWCYICQSEDIKGAIVAHATGPFPCEGELDHILVCKKCDIPEGYYGCGCGG